MPSASHDLHKPCSNDLMEQEINETTRRWVNASVKTVIAAITHQLSFNKKWQYRPYNPYKGLWLSDLCRSERPVLLVQICKFTHIQNHSWWKVYFYFLVIFHCNRLRHFLKGGPHPVHTIQSLTPSVWLRYLSQVRGQTRQPTHRRGQATTCCDDNGPHWVSWPSWQFYP